jgi:predicted metal-dependent peptidase
MVSFLRRRVPFITEALGVVPVIVNDHLPRPIQSDAKAIQVNPDLWDMMCEVAHQNEGQEPWFPTDNAGMAYGVLRSCLQMVLKYDQRRGTRDRKIWAEAVNNITNQMLVDIFKMEPFSYHQGSEKHKQLVDFLTSTGEYDPRFFDKGVEDAYSILELERAKEDDEEPPEGGDGPEGEGKPNKEPGQGSKPSKDPKKDQDKKDDDQDPQKKKDGDKPNQDGQEDEGDGGQDDQQNPKPKPQPGQDPSESEEEEEQEQDGGGNGGEGEGDGDADDQPCQSPSQMFGDDLGDSVPDSGMNDDLGQLVNNACADYLERHGQLLAGTGNAASREVRIAKEKPKITLTQVLKKIRDVLPGYQWSYRKPSRSDMAHFLQTGKRTRMPSASPDPSDLVRELVIVIDFSASMGEAEIKKALNIFRHAFNHTGKGRKIRVIGFTTYVVFDEEFNEHTADKVKVGFSGGTNIFSALKYIDDKKIRPSAIILCTDGECNTLDRIRTWHYLPRLRTILIRASAWGKAYMPGIVFEADEIM